MRHLARTFFALALLPVGMPAQTAAKPKVPQIPRMPARSLKGFTVPDEPAVLEPAGTTFRDPKLRLSFQVPAGWNFERKDGILSNFGKDVRSTRRNMDLRGVAGINFNPWPVSTFAGANFYYSVTGSSNAAACGAQATTGHLKAQKDVVVAGVPFKHGQDQHGGMCTESRDEVFTSLQGRSCVRFDLVVNTFCPQSSGAMEISPQQLSDVDTRLAKILDSIRIEKR